MPLPYPTKVVLPFDIATAQDMNERHANDVALAAGTGLDPGAVGPDALAQSAYDLIGSYSTSEVATKYKWIDDKIIYKKTVDVGTYPNSTTKTVAHGITGLSLLIDLTGYAADNTGQNIPVNMPYPPSNPASISAYINGSNITIITGTDRTAFSGHITLWYTKT